MFISRFIIIIIRCSESLGRALHLTVQKVSPRTRAIAGCVHGSCQELSHPGVQGQRVLHHLHDRPLLRRMQPTAAHGGWEPESVFVRACRGGDSALGFTGFGFKGYGLGVGVRGFGVLSQFMMELLESWQSLM